MITIMRSRLTASLATVVVTSATVVGLGAGTASAQALPLIVPQHVVGGLVSQVRAAIPPEALAAVGSSAVACRDVSGGLREGIVRVIGGYRVAHGLGTLAPNSGLHAEATE